MPSFFIPHYLSSLNASVQKSAQKLSKLTLLLPCPFVDKATAAKYNLPVLGEPLFKLLQFE